MRKIMYSLLVAWMFLCMTACAASQTSNETTQHIHNYTKKVTAPTCTEGGYTTYTCSCGEEYREGETEPTGHQYEATVIDPTCTEKGYTVHACVCGDSYKDQEMPEFGHNYIETVTAPTCTEQGFTTHSCACGHSYTDKQVSAVGHKWGAWTVSQAHSCIRNEISQRSCSVCKENQEKVTQEAGHNWGGWTITQKLTCKQDEISQRSCRSCGQSQNKTTQKSSGKHSYTNGACVYCSASDPNYVPEFKTGEIWTVSGQWELSFKDAVVVVENGGKQTVEVTWKYKNLGYAGKLDIGLHDFDVYDGESEVADWTFYDVDYANQSGAECIKGGQATCTMGWVLNNTSTAVTIYVELEDSNGNEHTAIFHINVIAKEDQPEEDRLNGCTITIDNDLPQTIYYYSYSGSISSSCQVTDVHLEVSGDDLKIYVSGKKTYDKNGSGQSSSCKIGWKLYDANNNVIESGTIYTESLAMGEGFLDADDTAYNCIEAGSTYRLVLLNVN